MTAIYSAMNNNRTKGLAMDENIYDYIIDAMNGALSALDSLQIPDFNEQQNQLDRAIDLFYDWYKTKGQKDGNKKNS